MIRWNEAHPNYAKEYRVANREKLLEQAREYRRTPEGRATKAKYRLRNPGAKRAHAAKRRARFSGRDQLAIQKFYAGCPEGYHVDHIIPLNGRQVSGLHVIENLQYLPARDNMKKGNSYDYLTER